GIAINGKAGDTEIPHIALEGLGEHRLPPRRLARRCPADPADDGQEPCEPENDCLECFHSHLLWWDYSHEKAKPKHACLSHETSERRGVSPTCHSLSAQFDYLP